MVTTMQIESIQDHEYILNKYGINIYNYGSFMYNEYPHKSVWNYDFPEQDYIRHLCKSDKRPKTLYVHIPFCEKQCYYCLCNTIITKSREPINSYLDALFNEIDTYAEIFDKNHTDPNFKRIHIGGGSPTFLTRGEFTRLVDKLKSIVDPARTEEFALEIDPRNTTPEDLAFYSSLGVNRISVGVQDFEEDVQVAINRIQPYRLTENIMHADIRKEFRGINFDILCGLPRQTSESFSRTIESVLQLGPDRIMLMFFSYTPEVKKHQKNINPDDIPGIHERTQLYQRAVERLTSAGYVRIGVDHFARASDDLAQALNDRKIYWNTLGYVSGEERDWLGIGLASSSFVNASCYTQNAYDLNEYKRLTASRKVPLLRGHVRTEDDRLRAVAINEFRCYRELDTELFSLRNDINFDSYFERELSLIEALREDGLVDIDNGRIRLTEFGMYYSGMVLGAFDSYRTPTLKEPNLENEGSL